VEVSRLARPLRNLVDVEVERPRRNRVELELERSLFVRLAQRGVLERQVGRLDMPARLQ